MPATLSPVRRYGALALGAVVVTSGLLASGCAPPPSKTISGTIVGADGRYVDVMLGYDVVDSAGNKINMGLLPQTGYSTIQRINNCVPTNGSVAAPTCSGKAATYNYSLKLPSNAAKVYIEVYPKAPTPTDWVNNYRGYTGPAAGDTNTTTYGMTFRRAVSVSGPLSNVTMRLPKVCGTAGGSTGSLVGHVNGVSGSGEAFAWSMANDGSTVMGWGIGNYSNGNYRIDKLQSGQRYGLIIGGRNVVDYRRATSDDTLISTSCQTKTFNF